MPRALQLLILVCSVSAYAQELSPYDALLKRRAGDEVVAASKEELAQFSRVLRVDVAEMRSYRASPNQDFYLHIYRVAPPNEELLYPMLYPGATFSRAVIEFRKAMPESIVRAPGGTEAVVFTAGFSGNSGSSLECMIPTKSKPRFIHLSANSVGFFEGRDPKNFDREFRAAALKFLAVLEKKEPNQTPATVINKQD